MRELLDRGRENLESGLDRDPLQRAALQLKLGEVYQKWEAFEEAEELLSAAIAIWRRENPNHPDLAAAINDLATVYLSSDPQRAELLLRECIAMRQRLGLEEDLLKPMSNLAMILRDRGELDEAELIYREVLTRRRETLAPNHPNIAATLRSLALVIAEHGRPQEAEPLLREALAIRQQYHGPKSAPVAQVLSSLGWNAVKLGRLEEARRYAEEALAICRAEYGENHAVTLRMQQELADLKL